MEEEGKEEGWRRREDKRGGRMREKREKGRIYKGRTST
jgi:hypothetical protein